MEHLAIDLGGSQSQICVRTEDGVIVEERRCPTRELPAFLARRAMSRVVMETCAEAFAIADSALTVGHQVRVVPATMVRALGVGSRRLKTDRRDAQILSEVSCRIDLPSVHIPSKESRETKTICGMRDGLVRSRTKLINSVRGWLRQSSQRPARGSTGTFASRVRGALGAQMPSFVARQLDAIDALCEQIRAADRELYALARANPVCRRLMSVPGVGEIAALRFVAAIDEISRFTDAHKIAAYLGLVPGEYSSSDRQRRTGITKAGCADLRWVLVQSAWAMRRARRVDPLLEWADGIEKRRGKRIAQIALARKIASILYAIWRDGTIYDPARAAG